MDGGIGGKNAVNGVAEEKDHQRQALRHPQGDADGRPHPAFHLVQLPGPQHVSHDDLGSLGHGDGVNIGHVGQHAAVDLGGNDGGAHNVDEAQNEDLGDVIGERLHPRGHGDAQQALTGGYGEWAQIAQGKAHGALAVQHPDHQDQSHGLGNAGGHGSTRHPHPGETEKAVDEDGVARHVQKVHHHRHRHHLLEEGVAAQHGAKLDVQPLDHHGAAYDAGIETGPGEGLRRGAQQGEKSLGKAQ